MNIILGTFFVSFLYGFIMSCRFKNLSVALGLGMLGGIVINLVLFVVPGDIYSNSLILQSCALFGAPLGSLTVCLLPESNITKRFCKKLFS